MSALESLYRSRLGHAIARRAGLADPPQLRRGAVWPTGPLALAAAPHATLAADTLALMGRPTIPAPLDTADAVAGAAGADGSGATGTPLGALLIDATTMTRLDHLEMVRAASRPAMRALEASGRLIILAPEGGTDWEDAATARALDGIMRTISKELRRGATANLIRVAPGTTAGDLASTLTFCLQGRSAFVAGQAWRVGPSTAPHPPSGAGTAAGDAGTLAGRVVAVTGAARGIGAQMVQTLAAQGARVLCIDVPAARDALTAVAQVAGGVAVPVDITTPDAGGAIAAAAAAEAPHLHGIVHNAGITRDKSLANMDAARWEQVMRVNVEAQMAINTVLLDAHTPGGLDVGGRIVGVSSTSGLAGNKGQSNYAASKAAVAGLVAAMAPSLAPRGITVNAVAPGFIHTDMTAAIPWVQREIFQRSNALGQGGLPVDVAETVAYLLDPGSGGVTGQVVRVCGHNLVGA